MAVAPTVTDAAPVKSADEVSTAGGVSAAEQSESSKAVCEQPAQTPDAAVAQPEELVLVDDTQTPAMEEAAPAAEEAAPAAEEAAPAVEEAASHDGGAKVSDTNLIQTTAVDSSAGVSCVDKGEIVRAVADKQQAAPRPEKRKKVTLAQEMRSINTVGAGLEAEHAREAARVQREQEEAQKVRAAEQQRASQEEAAKVKAAEEEAAKVKAAEEEAAKAATKAAEEAAAKAAAEEKAAQERAAEEEVAAAKAAEEKAAEAVVAAAAAEEEVKVKAAELEAALVKEKEEAEEAEAAIAREKAEAAKAELEEIERSRVSAEAEAAKLQAEREQQAKEQAEDEAARTKAEEQAKAKAQSESDEEVEQLIPLLDGAADDFSYAAVFNLKKQLDALQQSIDVLRLEKTAAEESNEELQKENTDLIKQESKHAAVLEGERESSRNLYHEVATLEEERGRSLCELSTLKVAVRSLQEDNESKDALYRQQATLHQRDLGMKDLSVVRLKQQVSTLDVTRRSSEAELKGKLQHTTEELDKSHTTLSHVTEQCNQTITERDQLRTAHREASTQLANLQQLDSERTQSYEDEIMRLASEVQRLTLASTTAESKLNDASFAIASLASQNEQQLAYIQKLERDLEQARADLGNFLTQYCKLELPGAGQSRPSSSQRKMSNLRKLESNFDLLPNEDASDYLEANKETNALENLPMHHAFKLERIEQAFPQLNGGATSTLENRPVRSPGALQRTTNGVQLAQYRNMHRSSRTTAVTARPKSSQGFNDASSLRSQHLKGAMAKDKELNSMATKMTRLMTNNVQAASTMELTPKPHLERSKSRG